MLILNKTRTLQALERTYSNNYWITIIFMILLLVIFVLKLTNPEKLKGYAFSLLSKSFIEDEVEEDTSYFNSFQIFISLFSGLVLSMVLYNFLIFYSKQFTNSFFSFCIIFLSVFFYFMIKWGIEYLLSIVFKIKKRVRFFLVSKFSYLYSICFFLFLGVVLVQYSQLSTRFLLFFSILLFFTRFLLHFFNNKKLIFSKLFYFILYLCAFEIAPLLILFKLMF
ncbi:DUF4271 domain-containing protein [Polaribacter aquimarinus]|uniref:DUF4271 domain-containing protein n=1 Tax=Polaribacter aquimarinus TaxID=2100726 RepID=UPI00338ECC8D